MNRIKEHAGCPNLASPTKTCQATATMQCDMRS